MKNFAWAAFALLVAFLAGCGGGGGNSAAPPVAGPAAAAPTSSPSGGGASPFSASDTVAIPTPAPGAATVPVPLPSDPGGAAASATLSSSESIPADTTIDATLTSSLDSSVPAFSSIARRTSSRSPREGGITTTHTVVGALKVLVSANVSLSQAPGFTFTIPGYTAAGGATYWLALLDPLRTAAGWQLGWEGPATVSASTTANGKAATTFAFASNGQPLNLVAGQAYWIALYLLPAGAPSPTPVPSSVPTNAPSSAPPATVQASPSTVYFPSVSASPVAVTFSESGFTGSFTLHGDCTGTLNTSGSSPTFTLTPIAQGRCLVIGVGDRGASAVVHVGVVTAPETPGPNYSPTPYPSHSPTPYPSYSPTPYPSHSPEPSPSPSATPPGISQSPSPAPTRT